MSIVVRNGLDEQTAAAIVDEVVAVPWGTVFHAYGPADDVPAQLVVVTVGDDATREPAWWDLWGNIHHQSTIYEATVPAAPIIARLAGWNAFPDRVEAICFLREIADANGVVVWHYEGDRLVHDGGAQAVLSSQLAAEIRVLSSALAASWRAEPPEVRWALLWLLSVLPDLQGAYAALVEAELPAEHAAAWAVLGRRSDSASDDEYDLVDSFEGWVHGP